jgi:predicted dinucleotide-binding enzyme
VAKPRIGIIGRGKVGTAISTGARRSGYDVQVVGKDPNGVRDTTRWAEVIVLAVPYAERANALREMDESVRGKVLVDVTNALTPSFTFAHDLSKSGAEELQEMARGATVVKAFNTVFAQNMATGHTKQQQLTLFVAGDNPNAKARVLEFGRDLGFDALDAGPLKNARWLETLGFLNIQLSAGLKMGPEIGFKLVH